MAKEALQIKKVIIDKNLRNIALLEITDGVYCTKSKNGMKNVAVQRENGTIAIEVEPGFWYSVDEFSVTDASGTEIQVSKNEKNNYSFVGTEGQKYSVRITFRAAIALILFIILAGLVIAGTAVYLFSDSGRAGTGSGTGAGNGTGTAEITSGTSDTQGDYNVEDSRRETGEVTDAPPDNRTITFAGFGKYTVSEKASDIELSNPDVNFVNMKFTLIDDATGETVAKTGLVGPGKYVYVNVMKFYAGKTGEFNVTVVVETFDENGTQMNGITQNMVLIVK